MQGDAARPGQCFLLQARSRSLSLSLSLSLRVYSPNNTSNLLKNMLFLLKVTSLSMDKNGE